MISPQSSQPASRLPVPAVGQRAPAVTAEDTPDASKAEATSPILSAALTALADMEALKAQRDYEHERQRARKTSDFLLMRSRKGQCVGFTDSGAPFGGRVSGHAKWKRVSAYVPDSVSWSERPRLSEKTKMGRWAKEAQEEARDRTEAAAPATKDVEVGRRWQASEEKVQVGLGDLIRTGKPAKARKGRREEDFELIPHVRPVVVLDDISNARDIVPAPADEEQWEYVSASDASDDVDVENAPSYAKVLSLRTGASN